MTSRDLLTRAERFLHCHGRVLDRRLFAALFRGASSDPVLFALRAYRNDDGGYGHGLVPGISPAESSPEATAAALAIASSVERLRDPLVDLEGVFKYLAHTRPALATVLELCGRLFAYGIRHPWLEGAADYAWRALAVYAHPPAGVLADPPVFETLQPALTFLAFADAPNHSEIDRGLIEKQIEQLVLEWDLVEFDPDTTGTVHTPLDWAPTPVSPGCRLFTHQQIELHLKALAARQQADGGWPAHQPERRALTTLQAIHSLCAYRSRG